MRMPIARLLLAVAALLAAAGAAGAAETVKRFGNVTVRCTDDSTCAAVIRSEGEPSGSVLALERGPASRARWTLSVTTLAALADRDRAIGISVDNGVGVTLQPTADYAPFVDAAHFYVLSQSALDRIMVRLADGSTLRVSYIDIAGAPHTDAFRLKGLSDALDAIDDAQRRVVGDRRFGPPQGLPPAPVVDRQQLVAEQGVPPRLVELHGLSSGCEALDSPLLSTIPPVIGALSDTAMLYALPCTVGGKRTSYRLYLAESGEIGGLQTLAFAGFSRRFGWYGTLTLDAVAYDPEAHRLTAETRDAGGCAGRGSWVFDAYAFRLERFESADCGEKTSTGWRAIFTPPDPTSDRSPRP